MGVPHLDDQQQMTCLPATHGQIRDPPAISNKQALLRSYVHVPVAEEQGVESAPLRTTVKEAKQAGSFQNLVVQELDGPAVDAEWPPDTAMAQRDSPLPGHTHPSVGSGFPFGHDAPLVG